MTGVKQGCPLSPTLFGLCIDKLEEWRNEFRGEGMHLAKYVVKLLMYADDVIFVTKATKDLDHLQALELFCKEVWMQINTSKKQNQDFFIKKEEETVIISFCWRSP